MLGDAAMKKIIDYLRKNFPFILFLIQTILLTIILIAPGADMQSQMFNVYLIIAVMMVLLILPIGYVAAAIIENIILGGIYYLNQFLISVRNRPLNFMDIFCINDALNVRSNYSLIMTKTILVRLIISVLITAVNCFLVIKFYKKKETKAFVKPVSAIVTAVLMGGLFTFYNTVGVKIGMVEEHVLTWDEGAYAAVHGIAYSFFCEYRNSKVMAPEGYSADAVKTIAEKYADNDGNEDIPTNIIVIMNESLADYSLFGETGFNGDPLEKIHALKDENFREGRLAVEVYGGYTCNSEFEFLTGCSLAFLNQNDIPYLKYKLNNVPSMGNDLEKYGYSSVPVHPYIGQEWRRNFIYPNWFTEEFISGEKFSDKQNSFDYDDIFKQGQYVNFGDDLEYLRRYISDAEDLRKVRKVTDELNSDNKKAFIFNITMQNHGGYDYKSAENMEIIDYTPDKEFNVYLTLTKYSAEAYLDYIDELRKSPEHTAVLMFGDHQPGILSDEPAKFYNSESDIKIMANKFIVPYMLWANYDIDWDVPEFLSINYLSAVLKENCGLKLEPMDVLRLKAMEEYPVLTNRFSVDKDGNYVDTNIAKNSGIIKEYEYMQYNRMFDK